VTTMIATSSTLLRSHSRLSGAIRSTASASTTKNDQIPM